MFSGLENNLLHFLNMCSLLALVYSLSTIILPFPSVPGIVTASGFVFAGDFLKLACRFFMSIVVTVVAPFLKLGALIYRVA